jgi:extracellular factor (EF) 3-hydroxypalmitic acid methyl ester biosynthesis protein
MANSLIDMEARDTMAAFESSQGVELRGSVMKLNRHLAAFEIYSPFPVLRVSEALNNFRILIGDRIVYSGRAVVTSLVNAGSTTVGEVTLGDSWQDVDHGATSNGESALRKDFAEFMKVSQETFRVLPEFKLVVADMQILLLDLRRWLEQVELGILSQPSGSRQEYERNIIADLKEPIFPLLKLMFEKFEDACQKIEPEHQPAHRAYVKRQLHPIVLCAPFMYRTFQKPLGHAGDYEMVNMMVRDPREGASVFAKVLNTFFLSTPPVVAHRNRLEYLKQVLTREVSRVAGQGGTAKIFNLGCGPCKEVQDFIAESELSAQASFTLLDFNEETLAYTRQALDSILHRTNRRTPIQLVKKSVAQLLKDSAKPSAATTGTYDLVYCAGLFDYLPDYVCERLMAVLYQLVAPGGLLLATNVDAFNPSRNWMEFSVDWHLIYRDARKMEKLRPTRADPEQCRIFSEASGVNIFVEARRPANA